MSNMKYKKYNNKRLGNTKSQSEAYCFKLTVTVNDSPYNFHTKFIDAII
jgi:hypothetical protein